MYLFGLLQATLVVPGVLYLTESLFIDEFSLDVVYVLFFFFVFLFISFRFVLFHLPPQHNLRQSKPPLLSSVLRPFVCFMVSLSSQVELFLVLYPLPTPLPYRWNRCRCKVVVGAQWSWIRVVSCRVVSFSLQFSPMVLVIVFI